MDIEKVVKVLKKGGIAVIPTDTVYGIICDALNEESVDNIYQLKRRTYKKPMIILMSDMDMVKKYLYELNDLEKKLFEMYSPGPLTVIVKKKDSIPDIVTSGLDVVGVRIPDDKDLQEVIRTLGHPIVATSANVASHETITKLSMLEDSIRNHVDYLYDGGSIYRGASTIVQVKDNEINILRDGDLSENIREDFDIV